MDDLTFFAVTAILVALFAWGVALLVAEIRKIMRIERMIRRIKDAE